jgi:hypothetical protein
MANCCDVDAFGGLSVSLACELRYFIELEESIASQQKDTSIKEEITDY